MKELELNTERKQQFLKIDELLRQELEKNNWHDGLLSVFVPHTTAGVTINENADPDVVQDLLFGLSRIAPLYAEYKHLEGNSDAHLKALLTGAGAQIFVKNSRLLLGTWQSVYFCEYDGPRQRKIWLSFFAEEG